MASQNPEDQPAARSGSIYVGKQLAAQGKKVSWKNGLGTFPQSLRPRLVLSHLYIPLSLRSVGLEKNYMHGLAGPRSERPAPLVRYWQREITDH